MRLFPKQLKQEKQQNEVAETKIQGLLFYKYLIANKFYREETWHFGAITIMWDLPQTVSLNYATGAVTGSGTLFGNTGSAQVGDVIRFGDTNVYMGDAVIVSIASTTSLTIGSTMGLSGVAIAGTNFTVSQLPKSSILDQTYSETRSDVDSRVYGVAAGGAE